MPAVGRTNGNLMRQKTPQAVAPSTRAASINSSLMPTSDARNNTNGVPMYCQMPIKMITGKAVSSEPSHPSRGMIDSNPAVFKKSLTIPHSGFSIRVQIQPIITIDIVVGT